jgi:hypothetical protein
MAVSGAKEKIDAAVQGWPGSRPNRIALEAQNIAWGDEKSATCMATVWWTFPFRRQSAMSWLPLVAPNPTTSFPRVAGSAFI